MNEILRRHRRITAFSCVLAVLAIASAWPLSARMRGHLTARMDVHRGRYEVLGYGLPPAWLPEYARCLHNQYGVSYRQVAGCTVSPSLVSYVKAYDEISAAAVRRRFGRDIFKECADEAQIKWKKRASEP